MSDGGKPLPSSNVRSPVLDAFIGCERRLKRFVARLCRSEADADDITHEALVAALRAEAAHAIEHPEAYLYRAARNLAIRDQAKRSREVAGLVDSASDTLASSEPSAEEQVISRERFALFCEAVATLPPNCRRVFVMRKVYGYTHKEISERLDISTSTVEKHLATGFARCLAALKAQDRDNDDAPARSSAFTARRTKTRQP